MAAPVRIGLVLSAGGLRGAAHLGVLGALVAAGVPIDSIAGASAGAVIGAYYAAVGLTVDELLDDAGDFRGRHLVAHSLNIRTGRRLGWWLERWSGVIPRRLQQLASSDFDVLHHRVRAIGVVCHDLTNRRPRYLVTGDHGAVSLYDAVATSAAIPTLFAPRPILYDGQRCLFTDGGLSDPLPMACARSALAATHLIVSDCRRRAPLDAALPRVVYLSPRPAGTTVLSAPRTTLLDAVTAGARTVTPAVVDRIRGWMREG